MKLIIVESPNKKATIKSFLDKNRTVAASVGHIRNIKDTGYYNTGIDPNNNFDISFEISADKKDVVKELRTLVKNAEEVYLASDEDREGEAIARHLKEVLKLKAGQYKRVTFNEITQKEVLKGLNNPRDIDENLVHAALARSAIDKLMGYRISPVVMKKTQGKSAGRVQSSALKIVVDKEKEIQNFVPHKYYEIELIFEKNNLEYKAKYAGMNADDKTGEITDMAEANKIVSACKPGKYIVSNIEENKRSVSAKVPFTTSSFQQECSSKLGIAPKEAMRCAQKLFEGLQLNGQHTGLITYIRTDSTRMDDDFKKLLYSHIVATYGKEYKGKVKETKSKSKEQGAHECIRIVDINLTPASVKQYLPDMNCYRVYKLIYDRTISAAMSDCQMSDQTIKIMNGKHRFEITGHLIEFEGWKKVYTYKDNSDDDESFPSMQIKEKVNDKSLNLLEKQTNPPKRYSEAKLIKAMEDYGIGRPSTYASTMAILTDPNRNYTRIEKTSLVPTSTGIEVSEFLDNNFSGLINLQYTSTLEKELDEIAIGKKTYEEVLASFYAELNSEISKAGINSIKYVGRKCPDCGHELVYRKSMKGTEFIGCSNYPSCKYAEFMNSNITPKKSTSEVTNKRCPICNGKLVKRKNKKGEYFYGCSNYPSCKNTMSQKEFDKLPEEES